MAGKGGAPRKGGAGPSTSMRTRRAGGAGAGHGGVNIKVQFYAEDGAGAKIAPITVLIMSIGFIAFVAILHVLGKFYFLPKVQLVRKFE